MSNQATAQLLIEADSDNETKHPRINNLLKIKKNLKSYKDLRKSLKQEVEGCLVSSQEASKTVGEINGYFKGEK